jgi:hypothetical protein
VIQGFDSSDTEKPASAMQPWARSAKNKRSTCAAIRLHMSQAYTLAEALKDEEMKCFSSDDRRFWDVKPSEKLSAPWL